MSEKDIKKERQFLPPLAELIDRLTVTQIKQALLGDKNKDFSNEMKKISHDMDIIIEKENIKLDSRVIRIIVLISQMNLHIWKNKDLMQENLNNNDKYLELLKLAHQLNGIRNKMKNQLLVIEGTSDESQKKSNFETDNLDWDIDL
jgi:flagellar biosynthesis/type III secretory pathway chaperone